jgi:hypothetical protein
LQREVVEIAFLRLGLQPVTDFGRSAGDNHSHGAGLVEVSDAEEWRCRVVARPQQRQVGKPVRECRPRQRFRPLMGVSEILCVSRIN